MIAALTVAFVGAGSKGLFGRSHGEVNSSSFLGARKQARLTCVCLRARESAALQLSMVDRRDRGVTGSAEGAPMLHDKSGLVGRRHILRAVFSGLLMALVLNEAPDVIKPALADRTGKFSTKLTAKRRYLPRIDKGRKALLELQSLLSNESGEWRNAATSFAEGPGDDMKSALVLFATTYFSEGNKIGEIERKLQEEVDAMYKHLSALQKASERQQALSECSAALRRLDEGYLVIAKLSPDALRAPTS